MGKNKNTNSLFIYLFSSYEKPKSMRGMSSESAKLTRALRITLTFVLVLVILLSILYATVQFNIWAAVVFINDREESLIRRTAPLFLYSIASSILSFVFHPIAKLLTEFENHDSQVDTSH